MKAESKYFPVRLMCRVLELRSSGYYAWLKRPRTTDRIRSDQEVLTAILKIDREVKQVYGVPRMTSEPRDRGFVINHKRVERIMRENGIQGVPKRKFKVTTNSKHRLPVAENLLNQEFDVAQPNQVWASDISVPQQSCMRDEGKAPRNRLTGAGCKPPQAAWVKSPGRERCGKGTPRYQV